MVELTLENIEEAVEEYFNSNPKGFIKDLGNGLYKVGNNTICGENMLNQLKEKILEEIKK